MNSDDAGALAQGSGGLRRRRRGRLELTAAIDETLPSRPVSGRIGIDGFKIANMPVLARLLTVASLTGIANLFDGEGISFARFEAPFDFGTAGWRSERRAPSARRSASPLEGTLDRPHDRIALRGTLVPSTP